MDDRRRMEATTTLDSQAASSDFELVERHRLGDSEAFAELYQQFATLVYNLAYRMAGTAEEAEDLTQEVFLRIYRHLGSFHGRSSLKTWIYRITLNQCRSRLGRRRFWFRPLAEETDEEGGVQLADPARSPEDLTLASDASRQIRSALTQLKPAFREAVILRDLEGLSYEEIAAILGVRIGTVRSRIARGRDGLRVALEAP